MAQERAVTLFKDLELIRRRIDLTITSSSILGTDPSSHPDVSGRRKVVLGSSLFDMSYSAVYPPPSSEDELSIIPATHLLSNNSSGFLAIQEADELLSSFRQSIIHLQIQTVGGIRDRK